MIRLLFALVVFPTPLLWADSYTSNWSISLGCPMHEATSQSGSMSFGAGGFSGSGSCARLSNGFGKYNFSSSGGGTLRSNDVYPLQMGKLSFVPPLRTIDTTPIFAVEASCPTATRAVNWVFVQSAASRTGEYFWGKSTMTPTSTTMTEFYDIDGNQGFNGNYSLPVGSCSSGVFDVAGTNDFQAKIYSADDWSGFYKTGPGNVSFFAPPWEITQSYLGSKTYVGLLYSSQDGDSSRPVQVVSNAGGTTFTVKPYSNPETSTLDTGAGSFTDTITILAVNSPLSGMMRGTVSRIDHNSTPVGTTEKVGCLAYETGLGGTILSCAGKNPADNTTQYAVNFNHKPVSGSLDTTFSASGANGAGKYNVNFSGSSFDLARSVAIQSDGKIVVAGLTDASGSEDFAVIRLNPDGTLDTSFNPSGTYGAGKVSIDVFEASEEGARAVAIQPDGKIIVVGETSAFAGGGIAVIRLNANGALDTSFNPSGTYGAGIQVIGAVWEEDAELSGAALAIQSDGKILAGGTATSADGNDDFLAIRLNSDGTLDTNFNPSGIHGAGIQTINVSGSSDDEAYALGIQADGKILLGGQSDASGSEDFTVVRLATDGTLDTTFNPSGTYGAGKQTIDFSEDNYDYFRAMAIQADDKIVLGGYSTVSEGDDDDFAVIRLNSDGTLDTTFNPSGIYGAGKQIVDVAGGSEETGYALAIQSDGKILIAGTSWENDDDFSLARLNSDGTLDTTFNPFGVNGGGKQLFNFAEGSSDGARSMALQSDGKIVLVGSCEAAGVFSLGVIRLFP